MDDCAPYLKHRTSHAKNVQKNDYSCCPEKLFRTKYVNGSNNYQRETFGILSFDF